LDSKLYVHDVVVKKLTFAVSSRDELLVLFYFHARAVAAKVEAMRSHQWTAL